jgi:hypothetical protein
MASKIIVDQLEKTGGTLTALTLPSANASASEFLQNDGSGAMSWAALPASGSVIKMAFLVDEKANNTNGGTFTSGAWRQRDLNTEYYDTIGVTIVTNKFKLPVGTFYIDWSAPFASSANNQSRLWNVDDGVVVKYGQNQYGQLSYVGAGSSDGSATVATTIVLGTEFQIEHRCDNTYANTGFGHLTNYSNVCVFTTVKIMQIA